MENIKKFEEFIDDVNEKSSSVTEENDMLFEMALVGYFNALKSNCEPESSRFKVFVNGGGDVPHMHIWDDDTNGNQIHTCVCLTKIEDFFLSQCDNLCEIHFERKGLKSVRWGEDILNGVDKSQCVIFVPNGIAAEYKAHPAFEGFKIVEEQPPLKKTKK
ncbi:MAG: hypothetical protein J6S89_04160 [Paludibacteraceae bacterium]|nr:hypothetical protein [Paludibacteraceae bacterium]